MATKNDIIGLLEHLGCVQFSEKEDSIGPKIICTCPMHADNSPSFMLRPDTHVFNCYVCGGGRGLATLVMRSKDIKVRAKAVNLVEKYVDLSQRSLNQMFKEERSTDVPILPEITLAAYSELPQEALDYLTGRGFEHKTLTDHSIGYDRYAKRIIVPIRNRNERLVALIGRSIIKKPKRRYLIYDKAQKEFMILGLDHVDWTKPVMVVEGALDYLMARQHGFRNVICILGSHASVWQLKMLAKAKKLLLFLDNDEAGVDGTLLIMEALPDSNIVVPCYSDKDKDVGAMSYGRFLSLIRTAKPPYARVLKKFD